MEGTSWGLSWGIWDLQKGASGVPVGGRVCVTPRKGCVNPCTPSRPGRAQLVPSIPQPWQGFATTRDGHKCHQILPPL